MPLRHKVKWKYEGRTAIHEHHEIVNKGLTVLQCAMYDDYFHVLSYSSIHILSLAPLTVIIQREKMDGKNRMIQQCAATNFPLMEEISTMDIHAQLRSQKSHHIYTAHTFYPNNKTQLRNDKQ